MRKYELTHMNADRLKRVFLSARATLTKRRNAIPYFVPVGQEIIALEHQGSVKHRLPLDERSPFFSKLAVFLSNPNQKTFDFVNKRMNN